VEQHEKPWDERCKQFEIGVFGDDGESRATYDDSGQRVADQLDTVVSRGDTAATPRSLARRPTRQLACGQPVGIGRDQHITLPGLVPRIYAVARAVSLEAETSCSRKTRTRALRHGVDARDKPGQGEAIRSTNVANRAEFS
jgi:hypothetical protein